ncbi:MAG TPA: SirB2 family protein [Steroidobacteraceae bacterium]
MIEFYAEIKLAHVIAVIASGALFLLRGVLVQAGHPHWALAAFPRFLSYTIDTALLTAALMLLTILPSSVYANGWLMAKLALLPVYIGFGWLALRGDAARQFAYFAAALLAYGCMFAIARAHSPLGPISSLLGA